MFELFKKSDKLNTVSKETKSFQLELLLALIVAVLASLASFSTLLFCSNDLYPVTADSMGHLTKVRYLAECFSKLEFPSWFPQWYNGSTVMQYYPPLSYIMMAPIEMICHNVTLTYKIFCFFVLFSGGMGIWLFCRKYIGNWCGLFGIIVYCIQPFLTRSLYGAGVLAQGPVFAISPWYVLFILSYCLNPTKLKLFLISTLTFLLIISHAMHAFMVCFCIACVLFIFVLIKKIKLINFFSLGLSMAIGALIAGYWWLVGATSFETPGVPYLLEEAGLLYTATWDWFLPGEGNKAGLIFGISVSIACIIALLVYLISKHAKLNSENNRYFVLYNILLTFFTFVFSFGTRIPFFTLVPLYQSLVPGRILSLSSVSAAIACAYLVYSIMRFSKEKKILYKIMTSMICIIIMSTILFQLNPYNDKHDAVDINGIYDNVMAMNSGTGEPFDKGRYEWIAPVHSAETYFPVKYGFNTADGWNIEGTSHNRSIWSYNIALLSNCEDYVIKDMLFWNVRSILTLSDRTRLRKALEDSIYSFKYERGENEWNGGVLYTSDVPSSYFLTDKRNSITIGKGSPPVSLEFPFMVKDYSDDISTYSIEELKRYKLLYLVEPPIQTLTQAQQTESIIKELVKCGSTVIVEPSKTQTIPLFNVSAFDINFEGNPQLRKLETPFHSSIDKIDFYEKGITRALAGLDDVYYKLYENDGRLQNDIIGAKNIEEGKVYFIGMHLSQYLKSSTILINGYNREETYPYAEKIKTILNDLFSLTTYNKNFTPESFPVTSSKWDYKGGEFEYSVQSPQEITISESYTPRWKITVDGNPIPVKQRESLIVLDLPAGDHKVALKYGITKYGFVGYMITVFGLLLLILYLCFYHKLTDFYKSIGNKLASFFEFIDLFELNKEAPLPEDTKKPPS